jgi:dihydroxyacetone kinase
LTQIEKDWELEPARSYVGCFETSLNGPGFSISVGNITGVSRSTGHSVSKLFELLDSPTNAPAWPKNGYAPVQAPTETANISKIDSKEVASSSASSRGPEFNPNTFVKALRTACTRANEAEPQITKYDLLMGDGDCGEAVSSACTAILSKLDSGAVTQGGSVFHALDEVGACLEDIGGSLGAILSILVTAFNNSLRDWYKTHSNHSLSVQAFGQSLPPAMENLMNYTGARVGDRTVMDVLIPFSERLSQTSDLKDAVHAAENAAQKTSSMEPKFGRASYVGDRREKMETLPPDPGAYAVSVFLKGLLEGFQ